jgi:hypothetical protein
MVSDQMTSAKFASGHEYLVSRDSSSQGDHILFQKEFRAFFHLAKQPKLTLALAAAALLARRGRERPSNNISSTVAIDPLHSASDIFTFYYKMICSTFFCIVFLVIVIVILSVFTY